MRADTTDAQRRQQVGRWLRQRRDELKLSRDQLAQMLELDPSSITNAEGGKRVPRFKSSWEDGLRLVRGSLTRAYLDGTPLEPLPDDGRDNMPQYTAYTRTIMTPSGAEVSVTIPAASRPSWFDLSDAELFLFLRDDVRPPKSR